MTSLVMQRFAPPRLRGNRDLERECERGADLDRSLRATPEKASRPRRYRPQHTVLLDQLHAELGGDQEVVRLEVGVAVPHAGVGIERAPVARAERPRVA